MPSSVNRIVQKLFKDHLFASNLAISFGLSGLGDIIQQSVEKSRSKWNVKRTLEMSTSFGLTSGFLCHHWYNYLDRVLPGRGLSVVVKKVVWDQILFSPICITACILVAAAIEKSDFRTTLQQTVQLGGRLYLAEFVLWPPAQFVNFTFIPVRFRVLYDNVISLVYDTYTSYVKHQVKIQDNFSESILRSGWLPSHDQFDTGSMICLDSNPRDS